MKRRRLLAATAASASFGLGGCLSSIWGATVPLGYVNFINWTREDVEIAVRIDREGDELIDREMTITHRYSDGERAGWDRIFHDDFGEEDNYNLEVETVGGDISAEDESANVNEDMLSGDESCFNFTITLGSPGAEEMDHLQILTDPIFAWATGGIEEDLPDRCIPSTD